MRILVLLALLALAGISFSLQNVSSCQELNASDTYVLTSDLVGAPISGSPAFSCIKITSSDVSLDCDGFSISDNGTVTYNAGILLAGPLKNVTVTGCAISNYDECVLGQKVNDSVFSGNDLSNCSFAGIRLSDNSNNSNITGNDAHGNGYGFGIFYNSRFNRVTGNTGRNSGNDGIRLESSADFNTISGNDFNGNGYAGIGIVGSSNNSVSGNVMYNNSVTGININFFASDNNVTNNTAWGNGMGFRIFQESSTHNLLANNVAYGNDGDGFQIDGGMLNTISSNLAYSNGGGFFIRAANNTISNNTASFNLFDGFELQGAENNTLLDNLAEENGFADLVVVPYELADCNNLVLGLTGSGGRPVNYTNQTVTISGGTFSELVLCNADNSVISNAVIDGSDTLQNNMLWLTGSSDNVSITGVTSSNNQHGFLLEDSSGTVFTGVTAMGNRRGLIEFTSSGSASTVVNSVFSGNGWAIQQDSFNSVPFTIVNSRIGNVNISLSDEVGSGGGGYSINETTAPGSQPGGFTSFGGKFLKVLFTGDLGINSTTFHWSNAELAGFDESTMTLFTWNNTAWTATPAQTLNESTNSLTVVNLLNITQDDIYGLYVQTFTSGGGSDGGGGSGGNPELSILFETSCDGNTVTVRGSGISQSGASVTVDGTSVGSTDSSGDIQFDWDCGDSVTIAASKGGFEPASGTFSTVSCSLCAVPECIVNADCASSEICSSNQTCLPLDCPAGQAPQNHQCVGLPPQCTSDSECPSGQECSGGECVPKQPEQECSADSECPADEYCASGQCMPVTGCGAVQDHKLVPYECGSGPACPACPQGETCESNSCVLYALECPESGIVGKDATCKLKKDGEPCASCAGKITDPDGQSRPFTADSNGQVTFPLSKEGSFGVYLLQNGVSIKSISVRALPTGTEGNGEKPTAAGGDVLPLIGLLVLLIVLVLGFIYWRSRKS